MYSIIIQNRFTKEQFDLIELFHQYEYDLSKFADEQYDKLNDWQLKQLGDKDFYSDESFSIISVNCDDFDTEIYENNIARLYTLEQLQDIMQDYELSIEDCYSEYKEQLACYMTDNYNENFYGFIECVADFGNYSYSTYGADTLEDLAEMFVTDGVFGNELAQIYYEHSYWINLEEIASELETDGYRENKYLNGYCFIAE